MKIAPTTTATLARWASFIFWWGVTLLILIVVDDFMFGPWFWALAAFSQPLATVAAFCASFAFQMWLVQSEMSQQPNVVATWFINRLMLPRRFTQVEEREASIQRRVVSSAAAIAVSLLIGGALPVVFLYRRGTIKVGTLRRLAVVTTVLYATEFALIHGGYGLGGVLRPVWPWLWHLVS